MDKATAFQYLSEFIWHHLFNTRLSLVLGQFKIRKKKNFPSCRHVGLSRAVAPGSQGRSGWKGTGPQHRECWKERNCWRGSFRKRKCQETFYFSDAVTGRSATSRLRISLTKDKSWCQEKGHNKCWTWFPRHCKPSEPHPTLQQQALMPAQTPSSDNRLQTGRKSVSLLECLK